MTVFQLEQALHRLKENGTIDSDTDVSAIWYANSEWGITESDVVVLSVEDGKLKVITETLRV